MTGYAAAVTGGGEPKFFHAKGERVRRKFALRAGRRSSAEGLAPGELLKPCSCTQHRRFSLLAPRAERPIDLGRVSLGPCRVSRVKRWPWVVLVAKLDGACSLGSVNFRQNSQREIESGSDATPCDDFSITDDSGFFGNRPEQFQHRVRVPVRRRSPSSQEPRTTENEGPSADAGNEPRLSSLSANEIESFSIVEQVERTLSSRDHQHIRLLCVREVDRRHD